MPIIQQQVAHRWVAITPSNTANLPTGCVGVYVGGTGNVVMVGHDDVAVTFNTVPVGFYNWSPKRINSTSTTATNLVALFA